MEFKIKIEVEGQWVALTWEELCETIAFGNDLTHTPKRFWTGLTDKNGKEIYEGDLLSIGTESFGPMRNSLGSVVAYEVKKRACDYVLYRNDLALTWGRLSRLEEMSWQYEVIGNIFEHPELITPRH